MKILVTGNMGYVGPCVIKRLRRSYPQAGLAGLDTGYFAHCLTNAAILPECRVDTQYFADVRHVPQGALDNTDTVVHLAAISNDPMGNTFKEVTFDINYRASVELAKAAKKKGIRRFILASSCSMYGLADESAITETSPLNPLTPYAKSKVSTEQALATLADRNFTVTCLRFSTACGMSERLRLDLVLNDFVACAVTSRNISILSDGTPWRPLIHIQDMARAIDWAVQRDVEDGGNFLAVNVGNNGWNYQVKDLAEAVSSVIPGVEISVNKNAAPDKRSYRVDFSLFEQLAPDYQPQVDLFTAVGELRDGLEAMGFNDDNFRNSLYVRLKALMSLMDRGLLNNNLEWSHHESNG
jgi:nucleoside-diphosphate-sugar epimerase